MTNALQPAETFALSAVSDVRREKAVKMARWLVAQVQGTCALEGQGLVSTTIDSMIQRMTEKLLSTGRY